MTCQDGYNGSDRRSLDIKHQLPLEVNAVYGCCSDAGIILKWISMLHCYVVSKDARLAPKIYLDLLRSYHYHNDAVDAALD